jgi:MFS family permease
VTTYSDNLVVKTQSSRSALLGTTIVVFGLLMALAFVHHAGRVAISTAGADKIIPDQERYGITELQMGMVYSAFLWTYTLFMVPGGLLIDRIGSWKSLTLMALSSSVFVALMGAAGLGLYGSIFLLALIAVRVCLGIASVPLHPGCAHAVGRWMPVSLRGLGNGLITGAALMAYAATPSWFGWMMDRWDWPIVYVGIGVVTAGIGVGLLLFARDRPMDHPWTRGSDIDEEGSFLGTEIERHSPRIDHGFADNDVARQLGFGSFFSRPLLLLFVSFGALGYFQYLFFYWLQFYFKEVLHAATDASRNYTGMCNFAMGVGEILGGAALVWGRNVLGKRLGGRLIPATAMMLGTLFLFVSCLQTTERAVVFWIAASMFAVGCAESSFWVTAIDLGGRQGGAAAGVLNFGGNAGGLLAPMLTPLIAMHVGWMQSIAFGGVVCGLGALLWMFIDPALEERSP